MPARARSARTNGPPGVLIYETTFASASSGTSPRMLPRNATPIQPSFLWCTCHSLPRTGQSHCAKSSPLYRTEHYQQAAQAVNMTCSSFSLELGNTCRNETNRPGIIEGSEALEDFGKIKGQSMTSLDRQFFKQPFSAAFQPT